MPLGLFLFFAFFFWQPTAEQIRYAQLLSTEDPNDVKVKIKQVAFHFLFFCVFPCSFCVCVCVTILAHGNKTCMEVCTRNEFKEEILRDQKS